MEDTIPRFAFVGEAGVGKTTLLNKIALDWALDKHLTKIDLLLFVPLRELENCTVLGDILDIYVSRGIDLNRSKVEEYVRSYPKKVMLLLDGLDEYDGNIREADPTNKMIGILRGDELKQSPVIVTTRPWRAIQITTTPTIDLRYSRIEVHGFTTKDVKEYVNRFFEHDSASAKGLIPMMTDDSLVANHMAPYPIFCSMLCNMWEKVSRRETIRALETFSQLLEEMVYSLTEHWLSKTSFREYRKRCNESLKQIGKVAFEGLLSNKLVFTEESFDEHKDAMKTGCEIGVLSSEKRFAQKKLQTQRGQIDLCFPHKLFQEYLAGLYLAHLLVDPGQLAFIQDKLLPNYDQFRYLLYFTVAHCREVGHCRDKLIQAMCVLVEDSHFIMDIAFESHDELALPPIIDFLDKTCTHLRLSQRLQMLEKHTWSGYMFTLASRGSKMVSGEQNDDIKLCRKAFVLL